MRHSRPSDIDSGDRLPHESDERYRAFFETSGDALFLADRHGRILDVNPRASDLLGFARDELVQMGIADLLPPEAPTFLSEPQTYVSQARQRVETANRHKDGRLVPVEISGRRIWLGDREYWLINVRDISERKRLERALAERSAQLTRLNQFSKTLAQSLDAAWIAQTAVEKIRAMAELDAAGMAVVDDLSDALTPIYYSGVSDAFAARFFGRTRSAARLIGQMAVLGFPFIIDDVRVDVNLPARIRRLIAGEGVRTIIIFPIYGGGHHRGALAAAYRKVTAVDEAVLQMLETAVGHVGQALTNAWLFQREQRRVASQETLIDILRIAMGTLRLDDMLPALAEQAGRLLEADGAFITRWRDGEQVVIPTAAYGPYRDEYPTILPTGTDEPTLTRAVLETGAPIPVYDVLNTPYLDPAFASRFSTRSLLGLPLIAHGQRLGALLIGSDTPRRFTSADVALGQVAANLIGLAIDNAQLLETEERQRKQAETLHQVTASLTSSLDLDVVLDAMLDQLGQVVDYDSASIQLFRGGALEIVAGRGFPDPANARRAARDLAISERAKKMIAAKRALLIPDTHADPDWLVYPGQEYIHSWIGAPLFERDQLIGVLNVDHRQANAYDEEAAALVTSFAHQAAIAITNARLYQEERDRVAHLAVLTDIVALASSSLDVREVCQALADNMVRVIGGDECGINLWDEDRQCSIPTAYYGPAPEAYASIQPIEGRKTITSSALRAGRPIAVEDAYRSPHSDPQIAQMLGTRSKLALPLIADDKQLGAVIIGFVESHEFSEEEIARAARAAELVAVVVAKALLHDELKRHAHSLESEVAARTQALLAANEQLRSLDRLKSRLITHIGHEFRTPISNLSTYLRLLATGRPEKRDQYMTVLNEQTDLLKRLIETVTVFSEVDLTPEARPHDPWPISRAIDPIVARYRPDASAKSIQFETRQTSEELRVRANPQRVSTALDEILSNAISYTDEGGRVVIAVEQVEEAGRDWVCVTVRDTGVGIPADELPRVFEQFFRGKQLALQVRGIGMGLSLVQAIVKAEGGRVSAESAGLGQGSTFRMCLPLAE